ncbi:purine-binding chemotaxis protein CheW [Legionella septentrionalis]|nr:purine-binding chemotaxis protein CheW [Legionella septentrionalis]
MRLPASLAILTKVPILPERLAWVRSMGMIQSKIQHALQCLPKDVQTLQLLEKRAALLARETLKDDEGEVALTYVPFALGHETYGVPMSYVQEVMGNMPLAKPPFTPDFVAGIINRRGSLLTILDLKQFFKLTPVTYPETRYIIIVSAAGITLGFLADTVYGSNFYEQSALEASLASFEAIQPDYVIGLYQGLSAIINVEAIIAAVAIQLKREGER